MESDERFWRKFLSSLKLKLVYARGFFAAFLLWWIPFVHREGILGEHVLIEVMFMWGFSIQMQV